MPDPSPPRPARQHCIVVDEKIVGLGFFKLNFIGALRDSDNDKLYLSYFDLRKGSDTHCKRSVKDISLTCLLNIKNIIKIVQEEYYKPQSI